MVTNLIFFNLRKNDKNNQSIWNDHTNLNKFTSKKETRRSGTTSSSNAFKQFLRRPSTSTIAAAVDSAVSKVVTAADKSVNMLQSDPIHENSLNLSLNSSFSSESALDFNNCLNRLVTSPSQSSTITSSMILNNKSNETNLLAEFEEHFRLNFPHLYSDLVKQMKQFVERFIDSLKRNDQQTNITNSTKHSEVVQKFYKKFHNYIATSATLKTFLDKTINSQLDVSTVTLDDQYEKLYEAIMIMVESYVTNNIYDYVFPVIMNEFEDQDMNLQKRIRSFYWITNDMIGTCIDENSIFYRESYEEAINCK